MSKKVQDTKKLVTTVCEGLPAPEIEEPEEYPEYVDIGYDVDSSGHCFSDADPGL